MNKIQADLPEMVSVRLPKSVIAQIDDLAEKRDSSRTSVIRSAITTYFRLHDSILVPISNEHRQRLIELSMQNKKPMDLFAESLMARAIEAETLEVEWSGIFHGNHNRYKNTETFIPANVRQKVEYVSVG